jgi:heptaprenyl diphosphate synthase
METKKFMRLSMLLALSVVLNIIENMVPLFNGAIPGVKLGLANIVILFVLYQYGFKEAISLSLTRVFLVSILHTGLFSVAFFLSLAGAILSIIAMGLTKKTKLSIVGVSVVGSLFHSLGQVIVVSFFIGSISAFNYLPIICLFAIPTGIITGILSKELIKYFK